MSNVKPNRKGSLCKWVLLALIIVCTLNIALAFVLNSILPMFCSPFIVPFFLSFFLSLPPHICVLFGLLCSAGLALAGWVLFSCGKKAGRTLIMIPFLPGLIASALLFPVSLLGLFFTDQFSVISGAEKTICLFIMLAASVGALSLAHIWNGSKS